MPNLISGRFEGLAIELEIFENDKSPAFTVIGAILDVNNSDVYQVKNSK